MLLTVYCTKCNIDVAGPVETASPEVMGMMLMAAHAMNPHHPHPMKMRIDGLEPAAGPWKLRFRCTPCAIENTYSVHKELASAMAIAHHTSHEGHPIEIFLDENDGKGEKQLHPPPPLGPR